MDTSQALIRAQWQPILQVSNQVVLYHPPSKALTIQAASTSPPDIPQPTTCPYCHRPLDDDEHEETASSYSRVPNYFHLLALHNETTSSRASTPPLDETDDDDDNFSGPRLAEGYFDAFFREERKLGMGANGSVFLCQHVLDGNELGHFAVKKIAVGSSHEYLVNTLKEVRLLETLRHENIITYHHSWLESCRFSSFGPAVPTLFVLMQWAEGGSLDDFILSRQGIVHDGSPVQDEDSGSLSKAERIAAFRARTQSGTRRGARLTAVHLLSLEEITSLFTDIASGLAFLHDRSILHLDLKPGNVLLTWDPDALIPRAMLSDFGASKDMLNQTVNPRTGITGTLEYTAPEMLEANPNTQMFRQMDSKADIWSLGIILHKLVFFTTPYQASDDDLAQLQEEVLHYPGYLVDSSVLASCARRGLPASLLHLLGTLLDKQSTRRPTCEMVLAAIRGETIRTTRTATRDRAASGPLVRAPDVSPQRTRNVPAADPLLLTEPEDQVPLVVQRVVPRWFAWLLSIPGTPSISPSTLKALKIAILVLKIVTLTHIPPPMSPTVLRPAVVSLAAILAAVDVVDLTRGLTLSLGLAGVHAVLLRWM